MRIFIFNLHEGMSVKSALLTFINNYPEITEIWMNFFCSTNRALITQIPNTVQHIIGFLPYKDIDILKKHTYSQIKHDIESSERIKIIQTRRLLDPFESARSHFVTHIIRTQKYMFDVMTSEDAMVVPIVTLKNKKLIETIGIGIRKNIPIVLLDVYNKTETWIPINSPEQ